MDGEIGEHELLERIERLRVGDVEIFLFEAGESVRAVVARMEAARVEAGAGGGRGDLRAGEEALEVVVEERGVAEAAGVLPEVVQAGRAGGQVIRECDQRGKRPEQRAQARGVERGSLALVAAEDLVRTLAAEHDLDVLRG